MMTGGAAWLPVAAQPCRSASVLSCALLLAGCSHSWAVERAYDGHVVQDRFIEAQAYAAFLRGATAEASGDAKGALAAYAEAARMDPGGAEIWTRIAAVRCQADPRDARAEKSLARALQVEGTYARAWSAKANCALSAGDAAGARAAAQRAVELDPDADGANVLLAITAPVADEPVTRASLVALTVTARDPMMAWDALATWGEAHGDVALWARALEETARISPSRREDVARAAEKLAGTGETWVARKVAAAVADAGAGPSDGNHPLAARLAIDEAIARADAPGVGRRATRARLPLEEAAARALLAGNASLAHDLASAIVRADPTALGAQWVLLAASRGADIFGAPHAAGPKGAVPSAAAFVVFGSAVVHAMSPDQAHAVLAGLMHSPIVAGDDLVVRPAVSLALRGAIGVDVLPADGIVELAALHGRAPAEELLARIVFGLDARHEYLELALAHPEGARARELGARLAGAATSDVIVAAAAALMQVAPGGAKVAAQALLNRDASDPLLATTALRLAVKVGDQDTARRALEAVTALGGPRASVQ